MQQINDIDFNMLRQMTIYQTINPSILIMHFLLSRSPISVSSKFKKCTPLDWTDSKGILAVNIFREITQNRENGRRDVKNISQAVRLTLLVTKNYLWSGEKTFPLMIQNVVNKMCEQ